jgi:ribosomal biogenesis protein LAS1
MRSAGPLLKRYKALTKIVTRDASLKPKHEPEITRVLRDVERWISEAKVAGGAPGWDLDTRETRDDKSRVDVKERVALEGLCDALLEKGCLVPLSKKFAHQLVSGVRC